MKEKIDGNNHVKSQLIMLRERERERIIHDNMKMMKMVHLFNHLVVRKMMLSEEFYQ